MVGAYKLFTGASEEAAKKAEEHSKRLDELNTAATSASAALYDAAKANEELKDSEADQEEVIQKLIEKRYQILGLIDDEDVKLLERDRKVRAFGKRQLDIAQKELDNLRKTSKALATKMKAPKANADAMKKDGKLTKDRSKGITHLMRKWVDLSLEQDKNTKVMQKLKNEIKSFEVDGTKGFGAIANAAQRFQSELVLLDETMAQVAAGEIPGAPKPRRGGGGSRRKQRAAEAGRMVEAIEGRLNDTFDTLKDLGDEGVAQQDTALKLQLRRLMVDEQSIANRTRANKGIVEQNDLLKLQEITEKRNTIQQALKTSELKKYEEGLRETLKAQDEGIKKSKEDLEILIKNRGKRWQIAKAEYEILEAEDHRAEFAKIINELVEKQGKLIDERIVVGLLKADKATQKVAASTKKGTGEISRLGNSIDGLQRQFLGISKDPFVKLGESTKKIREQIQKIKDTKPFGQDLEDLNNMEKTLNEIEQKAKIKIKADIQAGKITGALDVLTKSIQAFSNPGELVNMITKGIGSLFGDLGGTIGGAIGGIIGGVAALGQKSPEEIKAEFNNFLEALKRGIKILKDVLPDIIPPFVEALAMLIPALIEALLLGMARLFTNIFVGIATFIVKAIEMGPRKIAEAIANWFRGVWQSIMDGISRMFEILFNPLGFADEEKRSGGRVSARSGISMVGGAFGGSTRARLHPGEFVVPQSGMKPQAVERTIDNMSQGGGVNLVINSAVTERSAIDELVRKIENKYRTFGTSRSPLFAS